MSSSLLAATDGVPAFLEKPPQDEIDVMQAVLDGFKDQAIARRLGVSVITVRRRVARFLTRVGAQNRIQAVVVGVLEGWLQLDVAGLGTVEAELPDTR